MQLIIEIGKDMLDNPNRFPTYMFQAIVLDGIPLQEYIEEIKAVIQHEKSKHLGEGKYTYTAGLKTAIDLIDNHIKENK